jgi:hypothetical protein
MSPPATGSGDNYLYLLMHLPKTGGTTINAHLAEHLGFDDRFAHLGPWGNQTREGRGDPRVHDWPAERLERLRVISGHLVHASVHQLVPGKTPRYFTFVRQPAALAVSHYNHEASRIDDPPGFWEWYEARPPNTQVAAFEHQLGVVGIKEVTQRLKDFWYVGPTEWIDRDLPHILAEIGVPTEFTNRRVAGGGADLADVWPPIQDVTIVRHQEMTDEISERVTKRDALDARLHTFAQHRSQQLRRQYGWV